MTDEYVPDPLVPPPIVFRCRWNERFARVDQIRTHPPAHPFLSDYHAQSVRVARVPSDLFVDGLAEITVNFARISCEEVLDAPTC